MANVGDLSVQLKADDNASGKIKDAAKRINGSLSTIRKGAVIASAAILGGFGLSIKQFLETGDELHKLSQRTGMTARDLDALGHFAELSGQDLKVFEVLTKFLMRQMVSLSEGAVVQTEAFAKLGFTFQNLSELTPTDRMIELIAALADVESEVQRDVIGFDIFGGQMIKVKNLIGTFTGKELKEFIDGLKANSFWTDKSAEEAAVFNDTIADTKRELNMIVLELVRGHIPAMQASAGKMLEWVKTNKEAIFQTAKLTLTFAKWIFILKTLGMIFNTVIFPAYKGLIILKVLMRKEITLLGKTTTIWKGITFLTSKAMLGFALALKGLRLAIVGVRIATMLAYTTALAPLLPFLAGIAALVAVVVSWWATLSETFRGKVIDAFKAVWNWVKNLGEKLGWLGTMWEKFIEKIKSFVGSAKDAASSVKDRLIPSFEDVVEVIDPLQGDFEGLTTHLNKDFIPAIEGLETSFGDLGVVVEEEVIPSFDNLLESLQDFVKDEISLDAKLNKDVKNLDKVKEAADKAAEAFERYRNVIDNYTPRGMKAEVDPLSIFPSLSGAGASVALFSAVKQLPSMKGATQDDIAKKMEGFREGSSKNIFAISDASIAKAKYNFEKVNSAQ
jgi:hypothetical protein